MKTKRMWYSTKTKVLELFPLLNYLNVGGFHIVVGHRESSVLCNSLNK